MVDEKILDLICCLNCQSDLILEDSNLICNKCKRKYIVKDNIPVLLDENFGK